MDEAGEVFFLIKRHLRSPVVARFMGGDNTLQATTADALMKARSLSGRCSDELLACARCLTAPTALTSNVD